MADINFEFEIQAKNSGLEDVVDGLAKTLVLLGKADAQWSQFEGHLDTAGAKGKVFGDRLGDMYRKVAVQEAAAREAAGRERDALISQKVRPSTMKGSMAALFDASAGDVKGKRMAGLFSAARGEVDRLRPSIEGAHAATEKLNGAATKAGAGFNGIGQAFDNVKHAGHDFLNFAGALLAFEVIKKINHAIHDFAEEALHAAASNESLFNATSLNVGKESAEEIFHWVAKIGDKTEFTQDQLDRWNLQLLQAGVAAEDMDKFIAAGGDLAARSADRVGTMGKALEVLTRGQLRGFVSGKDLLGLGIGVEQLRALPEFAGKSAKAIQKQLGKGNFKIEDVFSIIAGKDNTLGDEMIKASQEMASKMMHLKERPELFLQDLMDSPAWARLSDALGGFLEGLDPRTPSGQRIFRELEDSFTMIADKVSSISVDDVLAMTEALVVTSKELLEVLEGVAGVFGTIGIGAAETFSKLNPFSDRSEDVKAMLDESKKIQGMTFMQRLKHTFGMDDEPDQGSPPPPPGPMSTDAGMSVAPPTMQTTVGPLAMLGGISVNAGPINVQGGDNPRAQAEEIAGHLETMLIAALERTRAEQGA
jgi:hypothetical protein